MSGALTKEESERIGLLSQLSIEKAPLDKLREVLSFTRKQNEKKRKEEKK